MENKKLKERFFDEITGIEYNVARRLLCTKYNKQYLKLEE